MSAGARVDSPGRRALRKLMRRRAAVFGLCVVALFVLVAVLAPWIAPYDPVKTSWTAIRKAPSALHWFGTAALRSACFTTTTFSARPLARAVRT